MLWALRYSWPNLHASPRARRSWPPEIYPQISKRTDCAAEELCFNFCPSDGPLFSRMSAWRNVAFVNRTRRIGPKVFVPFRKIEKDSSGSVSWNIQPNCRTSFNLATTFYHHPYSVFLVVPQPFCAETSTYCRVYNPILTYQSDIREDANCHKEIKCTYLSQEVIARLSIGLPRWTPTSEDPSPRRTSTSLCWRLKRMEWFWFGFCTLITVVPETAFVSSRTLPFCFPLTANPSPFNTTKSPVCTIVTLMTENCYIGLPSNTALRPTC